MRRQETGPLLAELLRSSGPLLLDAALGTELTRRGADTSPPLWSARPVRDDPGLVAAIHAENVAAGADIVTAATFRTLPRAAGASSGDLTRRAVSLAREGISRGLAAARRQDSSPVLVAGSLAPLEDCYRPDLVPDERALDSAHALQAVALAAAGVDLILVETINTAREWRAATRAAAATGLPVVACAVTDGAGHLLSGEPLADAARALLALEAPPLAIGVNCVPARRLGRDLDLLARACPGVPLVAYGNTGRPLDARDERFSEPIDPGSYAAAARGWLEAGARIVGGCCGTTAAHTAALRSLLGARPLRDDAGPYGK